MEKIEKIGMGTFLFLLGEYNSRRTMKREWWAVLSVVVDINFNIL
jgi:hypothetical protein